MTVSESQQFQVNQAHGNLAMVLSEIKRHRLSKKDLADMKALEGAVQYLEIFQASIRE